MSAWRMCAEVAANTPCEALHGTGHIWRIVTTEHTIHAPGPTTMGTARLLISRDPAARIPNGHGVVTALQLLRREP